MLVHIGVTDGGLVDERDRLASTLRTAGLRIAADVAAADDAANVDVFICLLRSSGGLEDDGTHQGERAVVAALDREVPVIAYDFQTDGGVDPSDPRAGYALARLARLRRQLRGRAVLRPTHGGRALSDLVLDDLGQLRRREQAPAHDSVRSLHQRVRKHPSPSYDAFTVSMHNIDQLYWVETFPVNREIPGKFRGAEAGGAGANSMVALQRLGLRTAVAGAVGDDADGRMLRQALEDDDIATTLLLTVRGAVTGRSVMLRANDGGYSNVVDSGANGSFAAEIARRNLRRLLVDTASHSRVMHFSSFATSSGRELQESLLYEVPDETLVSYKPGTMDAALGIDRVAAVMGRCDALFVAESELDLLLRHIPEFDVATNASAKLSLLFAWRTSRGHKRPLMIALMTGMEDPFPKELVRLYWGTIRQEGTIGPDPPTGDRPVTRDLAGARDAIVAGVLFGLLRGRPPIDCANLANVLAVSAFAENGCRAALPRATQVRDRWRALMGGEPPRWFTPYG